jgi:hypothetical protein
MRIYEITESFDSQVQRTIIRATESHFATRATINDRIITVRASSFDEGDQKIWEVLFTSTKDGKTTVKKTGERGELQVFSFVIETIKELIARYQPDRIEFTSSKADENRTKLYNRMANRIKLPGYHPAKVVIGDGTDDYFAIERIT